MTFITMTDKANEAIRRGTNLKDSSKHSKHNYLWVPTTFGRIYNSVTFSRVSRLTVSVGSAGINYWLFHSPRLLVI